MEDQTKRKLSPIWHSDIPGMLGQIIIPLVALFMAIYLPFVSDLRHHDSFPVYVVAVVAGFVGVVLLFFARLPLYRERQFFAFGSKRLDVPHRRLYRLAYGFIAFSGFLLLSLVLAVGL